MNTITLERFAKDWYAPQEFAMTGGAFDEMLDAVKALPFRQWQASKSSWRVLMDGITALKATYTVKLQPDVRVSRGFMNKEELDVEIDPLRIETQDDGSYTVWFSAALQVRMTDYWKDLSTEVTLHFTDDDVRIVQSIVDERQRAFWTEQCKPELFSLCSRTTALRVLGRHAQQCLVRNAQTLFKTTLNNKRDKDAWMSACKALSALLKEEHSYSSSDLLDSVRGHA